MLKNLPIINQDLTSTDFAIVEGNYYRHIGNTNDTFTSGIIYYYQDGEFKKLGINDYNMLKNLPIINQDLTSTDFSAVEGTYYRHIGSTNDTFVNGTIYRYQDSEFKKLGVNDYNMFKNLPIINQDLDATGFVGIEGAYYRHIGSSTNEGFVPGTIYRYQNGILTSLATNNDIQSLVGNINTLLESIDTGAGV